MPIIPASKKMRGSRPTLGERQPGMMSKCVSEESIGRSVWGRGR